MTHWYAVGCRSGLSSQLRYQILFLFYPGFSNKLSFRLISSILSNPSLLAATKIQRRATQAPPHQASLQLWLIA
jgi:hypothetical protein